MRARFKFLERAFLGDVFDAKQSLYQRKRNKLLTLIISNDDYSYICNNYYRYGKRLYGMSRIDELTAEVTVKASDIEILTPLSELVYRVEDESV